MQVKNAALRLVGAAMIVVAVAPWLGAGSANAAVDVYLAAKWNGTSSASTTVARAGCDYAELTDIAHLSQGWHFVLPGGTGLTSFTASFENAGLVTVTTTDKSSGVVVQGGKGAVVFTNGADTLTGVAVLNDRAGKGSAATSGNNDMQLSHLCGDGATPPVDECTNLDGNQPEVPAGYTQNEDGTCQPVSSSPPTTAGTTPPVDVCKNLQGDQSSVPAGLVDDGTGNCVTRSSSTPGPSTSSAPVSTRPVSSDAAATSVALPAAATSVPEVSVEGTKVGSTSSAAATESPDVLAAEAASLPHTGAGLPVGLLVVASLGLLLGGGALMMLPGLVVAKGQHRRH